MPRSDKTLAGRVAIVTGAGRGIGRAIALAYAAAGAKVAVASRTASTVDAVVAEISQGGGEAIGMVCDVTDPAAIQGVVQKTVTAFGTVHILVNNAQGFGTAQKPKAAALPVPLEDLADEEWEFTIRAGASASFWAMKAAFPYMKATGSGRIINMGSSSGLMGMAGNGAYNAAKEAIRALTRTAAREWGQYGITANVICPMVMTDAMEKWKVENPGQLEAIAAMVPVRRFGEPMRDIAPLALFLASDDASYLTGMTYMAEGGYYLFA
jgi:NAD(P)-dependent dehydrogenase (short-subunit alcohol dehydrogenase family)